MQNRAESVKKRFDLVERIAAVERLSRLQTAASDARIAVMKSTAIQFWFWYFSPPDRGAGGGV
jgi:hypothetical protein